MKKVKQLPVLMCLVLAAGPAILATAQIREKTAVRRAAPPKFDKSVTESIFFDNIFREGGPLTGSRPKAGGQAPSPVAPRPPSSPSGNGAAGGFAWSKMVSATTIEDEVKELRKQVDANVTTPGKFAGGGHKVARRQFSMLAMLFAIIAEYDDDVRWKNDAATARDLFARAASNAKAGGSSNVYNEAKLRKTDLNDLVLGNGIQPGKAEPQAEWEKVADRSPLMQLLETRFENNLKQWTASKSEFEQHVEEVLHEAQLVAAIAEVLLKEGMTDADDETYIGYAKQLKEGALAVVDAVKLNNAEQASQGVGGISQSCTECHELYR